MGTLSAHADLQTEIILMEMLYYCSSLCGTGKSPKVDVYDRVAKPKGSFAPPFPLMASLTHSPVSPESAPTSGLRYDISAILGKHFGNIFFIAHEDLTLTPKQRS